MGQDSACMFVVIQIRLTGLAAIIVCQQFYHSLLFLFFFLVSFTGLGWSYPCDLWSVGCILIELCTVSLVVPIVAQISSLVEEVL